MICIGVISDTHLIQPTQELKNLLGGPFKEVDAILHAGDLTELAVLEAFAGRQLLAVCGNMDSQTVRRQLPNKRVLQMGRFRIGLVHGWGAPQGIEERIGREFEKPDCIVYGHTHAASQREREGVLFFNPGAFDGGSGRSPRSVGLLRLGEAISGQIVYL